MNNDFLELIQRVKEGDDEASSELVGRYMRQIKAYIRSKMDPRLNHVMDSTDILQSVVTRFWLQLQSGAFDFDNEASVIALLKKIATGKVIDKLRAHRGARKRNIENEVRGLDPSGVRSDAATPSVMLSNKEQIEQIYAKMTSEEKFIFDERALKKSWKEIGESVGKSAEAVRKQYVRLLERLTAEVVAGVDE